MLNQKELKSPTVVDMKYDQYFILKGVLYRRCKRQPIQMNFGPPIVEVYDVINNNKHKLASGIIIEPVEIEIHLIGNK